MPRAHVKTVDSLVLVPTIEHSITLRVTRTSLYIF